MAPDLFTRRAMLEPSSVNDAERSVDVIWSTGAPVARRDTAGDYTERLSLDPAHVNVAALIGAPVLDGHRQDSVDKILGVVTAAHVDGQTGRATIQLSERAEPVWRDVKAGILRNVSVGYTVAKWQDSRGTDGRRVRTAVQWTPKELSLVAIPADVGATVRGGNMEPNITPDTTEDTNTRTAVNADIRTLVAAAGLDHTASDSLIDRGASLDDAKRELCDALVARSATTVRHQHVEFGTDHGAPEVQIERMSEALFCRMTGTAPSEAARPYIYKRCVDMAAALLTSRGERGVGVMSSDAILTRAMHTTSDFPQLLTSTGNRVLLGAFEAAPNPVKALARRTTVTDFRTKTTLKLSESPKLAPVNEHGTITYGTRGEAKEAYSIKTFARIFSLSRQALINDDLGAFADFGRAAGRAAAETEADVLTALFTVNSGAGVTLDDGNPLSPPTHANVAASGTVIDVAALAAARQAMRGQKGLDGITPVNAVPKYLLVSPVKETQAEQVLASLAPATVASVNPFSQRLELLVEPRFSGNGWFVFADPAAMSVLEYAYLSSAQGPQMSSREGWDVLGVEFRVVLDFGAGVIDHRGAYRNAGA